MLCFVKGKGTIRSDLTGVCLACCTSHNFKITIIVMLATQCEFRVSTGYWRVIFQCTGSGLFCLRTNLALKLEVYAYGGEDFKLCHNTKFCACTSSLLTVMRVFLSCFKTLKYNSI